MGGAWNLFKLRPEVADIVQRTPGAASASSSVTAALVLNTISVALLLISLVATGCLVSTSHGVQGVTDPAAGRSHRRCQLGAEAVQPTRDHLPAAAA